MQLSNQEGSFDLFNTFGAFGPSVIKKFVAPMFIAKNRGVSATSARRVSQLQGTHKQRSNGRIRGNISAETVDLFHVEKDYEFHDQPL